MSAAPPRVQLRDAAEPVSRPVSPSPGETYRQLGVSLWGKGAYEREPVDGGLTKYQRLFRAEQGDIVVNKIWARNGSVAVVDDSLAGCHGSNEFPMFAPIEGRLDPRWMHWVTKTKDFWAQCDQKSQGTSGQNRIKPERFLDVEIPLPPVDEQRCIVARIEELAAKVEKARGLRSLALDEAEALSRSVIDSIYKRLTSEIGLGRLGAACTSITDGDHLTPPFSEGGVKFILVGNVSTAQLHFNGVKYVTSQYFQGLSATRVPRRGDLLYSAVGATLGIPAVVDVDDDFCFQRHVAILKPNHTKVLSRFLWHMLRSQTVFDKAWASTTGSAQPTISLRAIRELPIPLPPLDRQKQVVAELDGLQAKVDAVRALQTETAVELDAMLPAILDKAFKGEL
jgi:type I restriction enzyme S subunit